MTIGITVVRRVERLKILGRDLDDALNFGVPETRRKLLCR